MPLVPFTAGQDLTAAVLNAAFDVQRLAFQPSDSAPVNNSTTLVSSAFLTLPVEANSIYYFEGHILTTSATAADVKNALSLPAGSTGLIVPWGSDTAAASASATITHDATTTLTWATGGLGTGTTFAGRPEGYLDIGAIAGDCVFQFAQQTATGSNTVLKAGSRMKLTRVA